MIEHSLLLKIIIIAYAFFNGARVLSYLPQIIAAAKDKSGAKAISLLTWGFWTMANFTTTLYAVIVVPDFLLAIMSAGNTLGCAIVFAIVWYKRLKYNRNKLVGDLSQEFSSLTSAFTISDMDANISQDNFTLGTKMDMGDMDFDKNTHSALFTDNKKKK